MQKSTKTKIIISTLGLCFLIPLLLLIFIVWQVNWGNTKYLEKTAILSKVREETLIYYDDEKTQIGSLFSTSHRRYTPIKEVPEHFLNAIIASEDKNFYQHVGVDFPALMRAIISGILKGRFSRGASTITQQTVKNIVNDWEPSFSRKFREMIRALQLETLYKKHQILEFYINQFYVVRNGNGIGIASEYYFNKKPKELTLVESAFIAGSLKGPAKYNPFIKYTKEAKEKARAYAKERKNYVLKRMYEQKLISKFVHDSLRKEPVPFNKGEFANSEMALVSLIKKQLEKKEILDAIGLRSKEDLNIAGYKIYSTIDEDLQYYYQLHMRRNLSRVESILSDFATEPKEEFKKLQTLKKGSFVYGKVEKIEEIDGSSPNIRISFGYPKGIIRERSLIDQAKLMSLAKRTSHEKQLKIIYDSLVVGDVLFFEVINYDKKNNMASLDLKRRPDINGGLIALDKGNVRAIVPGFDTIGYNRALFAKRQPGSLFKSLVFYAALQLGWSVTNPLNNSRKVFSYQGYLYTPRPDHKIQYDSSSLLWTSVMSENLAAVSLASKLLDKLNMDQFLKVMSFMDLMPLSGESERDFHYRLSKTTGVSLNHDGIKEQQLEKAKKEILPDLIFSQKKSTIKPLKSLWWGRGSKEAIEKLQIRNLKESKVSEKEAYRKIDLLKNNFLHLEKTFQHFRKDWNLITKKMKEDGLGVVLTNEETIEAMKGFRVIEKKGQITLSYFLNEDYEIPEELEEDKKLLPLKKLPGEELNIESIKKIWIQNKNLSQFKKTVLLHGYLKPDTYINLHNLIKQKYDSIENKKEKYLLTRYFEHHDFRIALGLNYIQKLASEIGIFNRVEPVLSLPLGTSDVTVGEVAKLYQTFLDGKTYRYYKKGPKNQLNFIKRIEDRFGNPLYEPKRSEHQIVSHKVTSEIREILRKTMSHGTGRLSRRYLFLNPKNLKSKILIPAFGKTGTTNDFTTSYFAGSIPYPTEFGKPLDPSHSFTIATYVGYDDNKFMRKGAQKIYGSSGAMPLWIDVVKETLFLKKYNTYLDPFDLSILSKGEWPITYHKSTRPFLIDMPRGLILRQGKEADKDIYRLARGKQKNSYYEDLFIPDLTLNSVLFLPEESVHGKLSLFEKRENQDQAR